VLGPVVAWDDGEPVDLKGPRHRAVLARLIVARGRLVPASVLVDDLWVDPPAGALSALRTFVAALRRAIEPDRRPRTPAKLLVTEGPGYALRTEAVDAWRFEAAVQASLPPPGELLPELLAGLDLWRGPAYAEFAAEGWTLAERSRLNELRLRAVERIGEARLALGLAGEAVPDLDAHVTEHPWREDAWRLLALALYRSERQGDALAVLRRAWSGAQATGDRHPQPGCASHAGRKRVGGDGRGVRPRGRWDARQDRVDSRPTAQSRGHWRRWAGGRSSTPPCCHHSRRGAGRP
jgi:DNA-binding SARP family transcriptional activator